MCQLFYIYVDLVFTRLIQLYWISTPWLFHSFLLRSSDFDLSCKVSNTLGRFGVPTQHLLIFGWRFMKTKICWPITEAMFLCIAFDYSTLLNLKMRNCINLGKLGWSECFCAQRFEVPHHSLCERNESLRETFATIQPTCMAVFWVCHWSGSRLSEEKCCSLFEATRWF